MMEDRDVSNQCPNCSGIEPYRKTVALEVVNQPVVRCTDCRHSVPISQGHRFVYLGCNLQFGEVLVRIRKSLGPHESMRNKRPDWSDCKCEIWNSNGQCERWEPKVKFWEAVKALFGV